MNASNAARHRPAMLNSLLPTQATRMVPGLNIVGAIVMIVSRDRFATLNSALPSVLRIYGINRIGNIPIIAFFDYAAAFPSVAHAWLFAVLAAFGSAYWFAECN